MVNSPWFFPNFVLSSFLMPGIKDRNDLETRRGRGRGTEGTIARFLLLQPLPDALTRRCTLLLVGLRGVATAVGVDFFYGRGAKSSLIRTGRGEGEMHCRPRPSPMDKDRRQWFCCTKWRFYCSSPNHFYGMYLHYPGQGVMDEFGTKDVKMCKYHR